MWDIITQIQEIISVRWKPHYLPDCNVIIHVLCFLNTVITKTCFNGVCYREVPLYVRAH